MNGARHVGRGLRDTSENLIYFIMMSIAWWACVATIVLAPAATIALFTHADPRHGAITDRPTLPETITLIRENTWSAWRLALMTWPIMVVLNFNVMFYIGSETVLGALAPFWLALFILAFAISNAAFALATLERISAGRAVKVAAIMVLAKLPEVFIMLLLLVPILVIGTIMIVPLFLMLPMTVAAVFNRFVFSCRQIAIPNPNDPTPERLAEPREKRKRRWRT